ncbi:hypothetical protein COLO4_05743 [Corchorus olitorius]|uniref:Uncharacterized protein n=1 Tax=Corchorus olitorius TaxID=93759 RepID=A0A1R3KPY8_9ROSI|nr:hypothetical protein COLO4_05743 [Corchorus olitorius]
MMGTNFFVFFVLFSFFFNRKGKFKGDGWRKTRMKDRDSIKVSCVYAH